jgi:hypothetical protein
MNTDFQLLDKQTAEDLQSYLTRAKKMDPTGLVRLRAFGDLLTAYVAPIFSGGILDTGPTVLGLRTAQLKSETEFNILLPITQVLERLARSLATVAETLPEGQFRFDLESSGRASWAGVSPPRAGWIAVGTLSESFLTETARAGIVAVAETIPEAVGGPIAARIRAEVWGRSIDATSMVPAGAAFAAAGLGFLTKNEEVGLFHAPGWIRLSSEHGHVLAKEAAHF